MKRIKTVDGKLWKSKKEMNVKKDKKQLKRNYRRGGKQKFGKRNRK